MFYDVSFLMLLTELTVKSNNADEQVRLIGKKLRELRKEAGFSGYDAFAWAHDLPRVQY